ncbi:uncharacterized protein LOC130014524 isoform X2 [Mercurialis annua]|uniref:uncharacterized protein LOC130014526 isoform X2 n=1 Tax=Mercurialis annua TaxID=3986 RepID=UPI0024AF9D2E|nr:uncharacterized protein LOC130014526 isoform X2 [Mercurialis annua]XP_055959877.1 uncharacterized protein LOC130014590 isoform X2 [Mercurialis annua]XP_055959880.1 uncharacterized protein LOC130014524 isoform X2 [Mercurialis annua]
MNIHSFQAKNCSNKGSNPQPFFSILLQNSNDHNFFVSQRNLAILAATERGNDYLQLYGLNLSFHGRFLMMNLGMKPSAKRQSSRLEEATIDKARNLEDCDIA